MYLVYCLTIVLHENKLYTEPQLARDLLIYITFDALVCVFVVGFTRADYKIRMQKKQTFSSQV